MKVIGVLATLVLLLGFGESGNPRCLWQKNLNKPRAVDTPCLGGRNLWCVRKRTLNRFGYNHLESCKDPSFTTTKPRFTEGVCHECCTLCFFFSPLFSFFFFSQTKPQVSTIANLRRAREARLAKLCAHATLKSALDGMMIALMGHVNSLHRIPQNPPSPRKTYVERGDVNWGF